MLPSQPAPDGLPSMVLDPMSLSRLSHPTSQLNNDCINQCMKLLYSLFPSQHVNNCALFSTYALTNHCSPKEDDNHTWRNLKHTEYWTKTIWIIPVHCLAQKHWVLCVVNHVLQHIDFFDSIVQQSEWMNNIQVNITPLLRLI